MFHQKSSLSTKNVDAAVVSGLAELGSRDLMRLSTILKLPYQGCLIIHKAA
ncbi:MAG: hypothetical protein QW453_06540 [Thermoprotei archaeon]